MAELDGKVRLLDLATQKDRLLGDVSALVWRLAFSPPDSIAAASGVDGTVRLWTRLDGTERALHGHFQAVEDVACFPQGNLAASASFGATPGTWAFRSDVVCVPFRGHP